MRIGSLFSGYGGLDLAALELFPGSEIAWHCEYDPAPSKILEHHWPGVPNLEDVTQIDWEELMSCKPDLERTQHMYDLYCQGSSLQDVAKMMGVSRQTVYTRFKRRGLDMRTRPEPLPFVEYNGRKYTVGMNGYLRATEGDRELLHRAIWNREVGAIPDGFEIHHIDHDKTHNEVSNFECLSKEDHARLYAIGCNQFGHKCIGGGASDSYSVDILTGGYP